MHVVVPAEVDLHLMLQVYQYAPGLVPQDGPIYGLNSEYVGQQTEILQNRMKDLMDEFIKIDENRT